MRRIRLMWFVVVGLLLFTVFYQLKPDGRCVHLASPIRPLQLNTTTTLTDGTITFLLNQSVYTALFPHLQLYRCRVLISEESWCQGPQGTPLLLLAVKSHPQSTQRRAILRRTWARARELGGFRLQPIFLMATTSNKGEINQVQAESREFGDILMWDFIEAHHNLSLKERCFLQWLHHSCPNVAYVFKGDDDLFVNIPGLTQYLVRTPNASSFIHGNIRYHSNVVRKGKYAVPHVLYILCNYPNYASGGGFILPGPLIPALHQAALELPVFPLDDVYLGFLALAAGLPHRHDGHFKVWGLPKDELQAYQEALTVHGMSMERVEEVWQALWGPQGRQKGLVSDT